MSPETHPVPSIGLRLQGTRNACASPNWLALVCINLIRSEPMLVFDSNNGKSHREAKCGEIRRNCLYTFSNATHADQLFVSNNPLIYASAA